MKTIVEKIGPHLEHVRQTPPRRRVVKRWLKRTRRSRLPMCAERLECGHEVTDPGKHAEARDCWACARPAYIRSASTVARSPK